MAYLGLASLIILMIKPDIMPDSTMRDVNVCTVGKLLLITLVGLQTSCMRQDPAIKMYVCVDSTASPRFTNELASILKDLGFAPAQGRAVDKYDHTNFVIEAEQDAVRIWAQNAPLDPPAEVLDTENYAAGLNVNPNQYVILVQARKSSARSAARVTFEKIQQALVNKGFREC